jgi:hypothetical protein
VPCVDIDDELYRRLQETAKRMGTTPEKLLHTILEEWLTPYTPEEEQEVVKRSGSGEALPSRLPIRRPIRLRRSAER